MADHSKLTHSRVRKAEGINSHLKGKARQRRQNLAGQAAALSLPRGRRNDLLPRLKIDYVPTGQITQADRRVRKKDAAQTARV